MYDIPHDRPSLGSAHNFLEAGLFKCCDHTCIPFIAWIRHAFGDDRIGFDDLGTVAFCICDGSIDQDPGQALGPVWF